MPHDSNSIQDFIARWKESGAAERANFQPFLGELRDALGVERPAPAQADDEQNAYVFERSVTFHNGDGSTSRGSIDLYKRGCFVLETKQGSDRTQKDSTLFEGLSEQTPKGRVRKKGTAVRGTRGSDVAMQRARGQAEQYVRALPDFSWQNGYGAFTVSASQVGRVTLYISNQKTHHQKLSFRDELIVLLKANGIEFDKRYF